MNILIAGAGIGGLTTALCMEKAGHQVTVFERSAVLSEVGAGLQCGANALRVMDYLGLLPELEALAVAPQAIEFCDYQNADLLYRSELGSHYRQRYGVPYLHIHRADLLAVLENAARDNCDIQMNSEVTAYRENSDGVEISLADGRRYQGDCLIAADGINSNIRTQMLGESSANFSGNVAWRGLVPVSRLPSDYMQTVVRNYVGPNKHFVAYYVRQTKLLNFVAVVENASWKEESWVTKAPWQELSNDFVGWHPKVRQLIDAVDKDQCYRWALRDHAPLSNWSTARVTLLGDAAHATLPFMASGAALAIEDARVLQRALDQTGEVSAGLQLYQRNRLQRTADIQQASRRLGKLYHLPNRLARKLAFKALQPVAQSRERKLAEYDANNVELV